MSSGIRQRMKDGETLIGSRPRTARKHGIQLRDRAIVTQGSTVVFADDTQLLVSAVMWATGFRLDHPYVELPVLDERGLVVHERGVTNRQGPDFLDLPGQPTRGRP